MNRFKFSLLCVSLVVVLVLSCTEVKPSEETLKDYNSLEIESSSSDSDEFVYCVYVANKVCYEGSFTYREDCLVSNSCPYDNVIVINPSSSSGDSL